MEKLSTNLTSLLTRLPGFLKNPNPQTYLSNNYVCLDFETTNIEKGTPYNPDNRIVYAGWVLGSDHPNRQRRERKHEYYGIRGNEFQLEELVRDIEQADYIIAHNTKFELGWLERCGLDLSNTLTFCTQIAEYVIAGNRKRSLTLEDSLKRRGFDGKESIVSKMIKMGVCPSVIPAKWLAEYCKTDVVQTEKLFLKQREIMVKLRLLPVAMTRNIFTVPLVDIEKNGMHLDAHRVEKVYKQYLSREAELTLQFNSITGGANVKSGPQMRKVLYEDLGFSVPLDHRKKKIVTPKGEPATNVKALARLKAKTKKQKQFLLVRNELAKVRDAMSKILKKALACVQDTEDGVLYANFNQTITQTQRLSSTGKHYAIQLQNIPRIFKPLFCARHEGWSIGEIDEAQLEYRVAVFMGNDEVGLADIKNNVDAHGFTASIIFKEEWEEVKDDLKSAVRKAIRTDSKEHTFKPLYGGSSGTPREQEYYKAFKEKHQGIANAQEDWKSFVLRKKWLRIPSGLIFYWPTTKVTQSGYIENTTSICNYPVQSFATADIVPIAATYQWHLMRLAKMESFLINTVHDSVIGEVHPKERELFEEIGVYCMTSMVKDYLRQVYDVDFFVPLEAECEFKSHWSDSAGWREQYGVGE